MKLLPSTLIYCTEHNVKYFYTKLNHRFPVRLTHFVIAMLALLSIRMLNVSSAKRYRRVGGEELVILRFIVPSFSLHVNDETGHQTGQ